MVYRNGYDIKKDENENISKDLSPFNMYSYEFKKRNYNYIKHDFMDNLYSKCDG